MIKQNMRHFNRLFIFFDTVIIALALVVAWFIRFKSGFIPVAENYLSFEAYMSPIVFIIPTYLIAYNFFNLYRPHRTKSLIDELGNLIKSNLVGIVAFFTYLYMFRHIDYSRMLLAIFFGINIVMCFAERILIRVILRKYRGQNRNLKHIVFVGVSDIAIEYAKRIYLNKHWGYEIKGVFDDTTNRTYVNLYKSAVRVLGPIDELENYLHENSIDETVITLGLKDYSKLEKVVDICEKEGTYTKIIPAYNKVIPAKPYIEEVDGLPVISIRNIPLNDIVKKSIKRAIDIFGSLFGLIVLLPLFVIIAIAIKVESKGPVFYSQIRVGLNKKEFKMYKFRSMITQEKDLEKKAWTIKDDPRVTMIGKILRRTNLDEFPQLFNVLIGDMSLIGPRPERPQFVEKFKEEIPKYMIKHQVRPGMTGWAQVHGFRGDTSIKKRIEHDLYYIENWTMKMDLKIILLTLFSKKATDNAY